MAGGGQPPPAQQDVVLLFQNENLQSKPQLPQIALSKKDAPTLLNIQTSNLSSNLHLSAAGASKPSYKNILTNTNTSSSALQSTLEEGELTPSPSVVAKAEQAKFSGFPLEDAQQHSTISPGQVISDIAFPHKTISLYQGKPSIAFNLQEQSKLLADLNFILVGKFTHGRPPMSIIQKFFASLKLKGKINLSLMDKKHIYIECLCKSDFYYLWLKLQWSIQDFPMRMFKWDPEFNPTKESSTAPVWIRLTNLPLYFFEVKTLLSIANVIGSPIQIDPKNVKRSDFSSARLCVELDVAKPLIDAVWISLTDDSSKILGGFWVHVSYDFVPAFCLECSHIGHGKDTCKRLVAEVLVDLSTKESHLASNVVSKTVIPSNERTVASSKVWKEVKRNGTGVKDIVSNNQQQVSRKNSFNALSVPNALHLCDKVQQFQTVEDVATLVASPDSTAIEVKKIVEDVAEAVSKDTADEPNNDIGAVQPYAPSIRDKLQQLQPANSATALPVFAVPEGPIADPSPATDEPSVSDSERHTSTVTTAPGSLTTAGLVISSVDAAPVAMKSVINKEGYVNSPSVATPGLQIAVLAEHQTDSALVAAPTAPPVAVIADLQVAAAPVESPGKMNVPQQLQASAQPFTPVKMNVPIGSSVPVDLQSSIPFDLQTNVLDAKEMCQPAGALKQSWDDLMEVQDHMYKFGLRRSKRRNRGKNKYR